MFPCSKGRAGKARGPTCAVEGVVTGRASSCAVPVVESGGKPGSDSETTPRESTDRPTLKISRDDRGQPASRYEILRRIAAGGSGVIYEAVDHRRGHVVALKTLARMDPSALYRFKQEFRAVADLRHPNLCTLHDLISDQRECFYTMELVDGVDFTSWVRRHISGEHRGVPASSQVLIARGFDEVKLRGAVRQLAEGIHFLHLSRKIHRDLKPENVMVSRAGRVVILDFGLTTDHMDRDARDSIDGSLRGTPAFMAPEQAAGEEATEASDWYGMGVMLFEALTGRVPFDGGTWRIIQDKQELDPPTLVPAPDEEHVQDLCDLCNALIRRDPKLRPTGVQVLSALGSSGADTEADSVPIDVSSQPLIGRRSELELLQLAYDEVRGGSPAMVVVHGDSGVGKSALVRTFLDTHSAQGDEVVLAGRCYENELLPYRAVDGIVDALGRHLRRLDDGDLRAVVPRNLAELAEVFPVLGELIGATDLRRGKNLPLDEYELRRRAFRALKELLGRIAERHVLVLYVDDLQWSDPEGVELLRALLEPPDAPPALLLASYRTQEGQGGPILDSLLEGFGVTGPTTFELDLAPLRLADAWNLASSLMDPGSSSAERLAETIARESRGMPMFVQRLARFAATRDLEQDTNLRFVTLNSAIMTEVEELPDNARVLLEVLCLAGQPLEERLAVEAAGVGTDSPETIKLLRVRHLIRRRETHEDTELEPFHDSIREAVSRNLDRKVARAHHESLAAALSHAPNSDPEQIAFHWFRAERREVAGWYAEVAGDRAASRMAGANAARLYRSALEWLAPPDDLAVSLKTKLAHALANAGRCAEAAPIYLEAAAGTGCADDARELRRRAAMNYLLSGRFDHGCDVLRGVLNEVGVPYPRVGPGLLAHIALVLMRLKVRGIKLPTAPPREATALELERIDACDAAALGFSVTEPLYSVYYTARAVELALDAGDRPRLARALATFAMAVAAEGIRALPRAQTLLAQAESLAEGLEEPGLDVCIARGKGVSLVVASRWVEANKSLAEAESVIRAQSRDVAYYLAPLHPLLGTSLLMSGELRRLADNVVVRLREAEETGDMRGLVHSTTIGAMLDVADDRPDDAVASVEAVMRLWGVDGFHMEHFFGLYVTTMADVYAGRTVQAWERIQAQWPLVRRALLLNVEFMRVMGLAARGAAALAAAAVLPEGPRRVLAMRDATRCARRLAKEKIPAAQGARYTLEAGLQAHRGRAGVDAALEKAIEAYVEGGMRVHAASVRIARARSKGVLDVESVRELAVEGVSKPERWAEMIVPMPQSPRGALAVAPQS